MEERRGGLRRDAAPLVVAAIAHGAGRYGSEGRLFHMPGRWEFVFEIGGARLTDSVRLE